MRLARLLLTCTLLVGLAPFAVSVSALEMTPEQSGATTLQVCTNNANGEALTGDIELLLVMDNSLSLQVNDPDGKRFEQVRTMLRSVNDRISKSRKPRAVRFSFITFAERATVEIPLVAAEILSSSNIDRIVERVRTAAPGNRQNTNYVNAIDAALDEMSRAASQNCRVVVWFTDGAYWPAAVSEAKGNSTSGGVLREAVCKPGGFSARIRALNVNIFPLYIEPKEPNEDEDPTASRDVMAHLTGHKEAFNSRPYVAGAPCSPLPSSQVGEVLAASNVGQLANFFADLPNIIEGGVAVACPTKDGRVESKQLPAGRYVAQISIVRYATEGKELTPKDLRATLPGGDSRPLDQFFSGSDGRFKAKEAARELPTGWKIEGSGEQHCIRAFAREGLAVQIRKTTSFELVAIGPSSSWLEGEDLTSSASDVELPIVRLGPSANCANREGFNTVASGLEQMFNTLTTRGEGRVCVDVDERDNSVFPNGIELDVTRDGQPLVSCEAIVLRRDGADEFVTSDRTERSSECQIDFRDSGTDFVAVTTTFESGLLSAAEAESCNIDTDKSTVKVSNDDGLVTLSLIVVLEKNRVTKCDEQQKFLSFEYREGSKTESDRIPVSIRLNLQPEPDRLLALIATVITVLLLLAAALAVLRQMTIAASALLPADRFWAVRLTGEATRSEGGKTQLTVEGRELKDLRLEMERVERATLHGKDDRLEMRDAGDDVHLLREMPPLRRMLGEPWAFIDDPRPRAVHPKARRSPREQSLTAPFREALMVFDDGPAEGNRKRRRLSIWALRTRGSSEGDQVAMEEFLNAQTMPLVDELLATTLDSGEGDTAETTNGTAPPKPPDDSEKQVGVLPPPPPPPWDA